MTKSPTSPGPDYIGDGVYVRFDGYHIWLAANDHHNETVALEPEVFAGLLRYARRINKENGRTLFPVGELV